MLSSLAVLSSLAELSLSPLDSSHPPWCRGDVLLKESCGEFTLRDGVGEEFADPSTQEFLLQDLPHTWAFRRVLNEHVSNQVFQVLRVVRRDSRIGTSQDLEHQALHGIGIEGVSQSDNFRKYAAK